MKGFLKRDWYLLRPNLCFYAIFLVFFLVVFFFSQKAASFFSLYRKQQCGGPVQL